VTRHPTLAVELLHGDSAEPSLLDLVDHLLDKGCVLTGELILGVADVDLIYVELSAVLCAVDRLVATGGGDGE
jgi:hypothetical protein